MSSCHRVRRRRHRWCGVRVHQGACLDIVARRRDGGFLSGGDDGVARRTRPRRTCDGRGAAVRASRPLGRSGRERGRRPRPGRRRAHRCMCRVRRIGRRSSCRGPPPRWRSTRRAHASGGGALSWRDRSGRPMRRHVTAARRRGCPRSIAWSPDGQYVVVRPTGERAAWLAPVGWRRYRNGRLPGPAALAVVCGQRVANSWPAAGHRGWCAGGSTRPRPASSRWSAALPSSRTPVCPGRLPPDAFVGGGGLP